MAGPEVKKGVERHIHLIFGDLRITTHIGTDAASERAPQLEVDYETVQRAQLPGYATYADLDRVLASGEPLQTFIAGPTPLSQVTNRGEHAAFVVSMDLAEVNGRLECVALHVEPAWNLDLDVGARVIPHLAPITATMMKSLGFSGLVRVMRERLVLGDRNRRALVRQLREALRHRTERVEHGDLNHERIKDKPITIRDAQGTRTPIPAALAERIASVPLPKRNYASAPRDIPPPPRPRGRPPKYGDEHDAVAATAWLDARTFGEPVRKAVQVALRNHFGHEFPKGSVNGIIARARSKGLLR